MFEKQLETQLKAIFGVKKVTYDQPGESNEQECIFVEVEKSMNRVIDKRFIARVNGTLTIVGSNDKMPYGFFNRKIAEAKNEFLKGLAFFDFERNNRVFRNIVQRTVEFTYFFNEQYDPNLGLINQVTINVTEGTP